ncbi:hypothetical protein LSH36_137g04025 [Paralvinella palmiformis]|uniref:Uncharacterized protein n=1 Tax=Paralvinella palmiformis TaxID=53620 RepID=A0AAD9JXF4_9ANNE|nr:hypothetical protein LSH36_137g04025 [Paralvinella palmiformis]
MKKNKLPLFKTPHAKPKSKSKLQFGSLKANCTLFARLYIAYQARQSNLDTFFEHENQSSPPSISDMGQLRQGSNSDVLDCITKDSPPVQHAPDVDANILDGAAIIHMPISSLRDGLSRQKERSPLGLHGLLVLLPSPPFPRRQEVDTQSMTALERFIMVMYSRTYTLSRVDDARKQLFTKGPTTIESIPPTKAVLFQHVKRSVYQALVPAADLQS